MVRSSRGEDFNVPVKRVTVLDKITVDMTVSLEPMHAVCKRISNINLLNLHKHEFYSKSYQLLSKQYITYHKSSSTLNLVLL